jgi:membrane associated rhomboid family serine protease
VIDDSPGDIQHGVMNRPRSNREIVFTSRHRKECMELRLVLDAVGIAAQAQHHQGEWILVVPGSQADAASTEIESYLEEKVAQNEAPIVSQTTQEGSGIAVAVYAGVLVLLTIWDRRNLFGLDWHAAGEMNAGAVMAGQLWRCFTALTLHVDAGHLIANLVFGVVLGLIAGRLMGGGFAWLTIMLAGGLGNFLNALVRPPTHSSLGASTAVFAALGLIVLQALRDRGSNQETGFRRWSPLIAGLVLFGYTGIGGERTDVMAHVTGFFSGAFLGWIAGRLPNAWIARPWFQLVSGLAVVLLILLSWTLAIVSAAR